MRNLVSAFRVIYGTFWLIFGLNGFWHFFPIPQPAEQGAAFMAALESAGYVMPMVYGSQIVAGMLLLLGRYMPLALLILAPIVGNIVLYDAFLNPHGLVIGMIIMAIYLVLLYAQRKRFMPLLAR